MKVLFITNIPSPYRIDFFNELNKYCDLTVLFERKTATDRNDSWYSNEFEFNGFFLKSINIGSEASLSCEVIKYIKKSYDVIVLGGYSSPTSMIASLYMKTHKIPYYLNADGGFINYNENKITKLIKSFFISSASYWLCSGEETKKYLTYYGAKTDYIFKFPFTSIKNTDILKSLISLDRKEKLKNELGIPYDKVILSVGQFIPRKGFDWMIEAYKEIDKEIGIYIIGGNPSEEYKSLKKKYEMINLHFIDFQNKVSLNKWYQSADLFVLPTREDIWGLVINEAMSQGIPVITTDKCIAGIELIENGKNGYVINDFNMSTLEKKTIEILNLNINDYNKLCLNNIKKSKDNTIEKMAKRHIDIFKSTRGAK